MEEGGLVDGGLDGGGVHVGGWLDGLDGGGAGMWMEGLRFRSTRGWWMEGWLGQWMEARAG